jgi:hypothetical protein
LYSVIEEFVEEKGISKKDLTMLFPSKNGNPTGWLWNNQHNQSITLEQYKTYDNMMKMLCLTIKYVVYLIVDTTNYILQKLIIAQSAKKEKHIQNQNVQKINQIQQYKTYIMSNVLYAGLIIQWYQLKRLLV